MTIATLRNVLSGAVALLCAYSCSSEHAGWDADSRTFSIPAENISLTLPGDDEWNIAATENLPANIVFCGIRPDMELCAMLFYPDGTEKRISAWEYPEATVDSLLCELTRQDAPQVKAEQAGQHVEKCRYKQTEALKFRVDIAITDGNTSEKYPTTYLGYIFPGKSRMLGFAAILPTENADNEYLTELFDSLNQTD